MRSINFNFKGNFLFSIFVYLQRSEVSLLLLLIIGCNFVCNTQAVICSLETMKQYAMDACEHLFLVDASPRDRRSVAYGHHSNINNHVNGKFVGSFFLNLFYMAFAKWIKVEARSSKNLQDSTMQIRSTTQERGKSKEQPS